MTGFEVADEGSWDRSALPSLRFSGLNRGNKVRQRLGIACRFRIIADERRSALHERRGEIDMLKFRRVCLEALSYVLPELVVSSEQIERELDGVYERLGLHVGRLELMTGIRARRFWDERTLPSEPAAIAGQRAMDGAGVRADQIECLIHGAVSRDCLEPATASVVHHRLGLSPKAVMYDISNACLGFINGMVNLASMIELGQIKRGLVVAAESSRQLVRTTIDRLRQSPTLTRQQFKAAFASLTIGSGAAAAVLTDESASATGHRVLGGATRTASEHNHLCRGSDDTGFGGDAAMFMNTDSETLLIQGCELAAETWSDFQQTLGWSACDVDRSFCHQVSVVHRDKLYETLKLDPTKDFSTFVDFGNVGSVSLPLTFAMGVERNPPKKGERIALLGIGSGLSCIMLGLEW